MKPNPPPCPVCGDEHPEDCPHCGPVPAWSSPICHCGVPFYGHDDEHLPVEMTRPGGVAACPFLVAGESGCECPFCALETACPPF